MGDRRVAPAESNIPKAVQDRSADGSIAKGLKQSKALLVQFLRSGKVALVESRPRQVDLEQGHAVAVAQGAQYSQAFFAETARHSVVALLNRNHSHVVELRDERARVVELPPDRQAILKER